MPRNTDPNDIEVGSGQAGEDSVTSTSLTINLSTSGSGGIGGIRAEDVESEAPLHLSGDDLQKNLYAIDGAAPTPYPNRIGDAATDVPNPSALVDWTLNTAFEDGLYYDSGSGTSVTAKTVNTSTFQISEVIVYPADRGVLAVREVDSGGNTIVIHQALDLRGIFIEGLGPTDTSAPSRWVSQLNYVAGSNPIGTVDSLPQGISLEDRYPTLKTYSGAVPYEGYPYNYYAYQIATATFDLNLSSGAHGDLQIVHYKSRSDYERDRDGTVPETYSVASVTSGLPLFVDADTGTPVNITAFDFDPTDPNYTTASTPRYLSGIHYYSAPDEFSYSFSVDGMFATSYEEEGIQFRLRSTSDTETTVDFPYTAYSSPPISSSDTASSSSSSFQINSGYVTSADPVIFATDPFGRTDTQAWPDAGSKILHHGVGLPTSFTDIVENFTTEDTRYTLSDLFLANTTLLADGSGSTWDPEAALPPSELQVRGIDGSRDLPKGIFSGELAWPDTDYSTGHFPTTRDGINPQRDYSALSHDPGRGYLRIFDIGSPRKSFKVRMVGNPLSGETFASTLLSYDTATASSFGIGFAFFPQRAVVGTFGASNVSVDLGGQLIDFEEESPNSVVLTLRMSDTPPEASGTFPVVFFFVIETGSLAATAGEFALYYVEIL